MIIRLFPDEFARKLVPTFWTRKKGRPQVLISDEDRRYEWNPALEEIKDQLAFMKTVRGGRLRQLKHALQHPEELLPRSRSGSRSRESSAPATPVAENENGHLSPQPATPDSRGKRQNRSRSNSAFGPAAAMAGVVAGSIAGWSPVERGDWEANSIQFPSDSPHGGLDRQQGIEIHPETADNDNLVADYSAASSVPPSQNPDLIPFFEHVPVRHEPSTHQRRSSSRRSRSSQSQQS